jgi:hypothetical protein
MVRRLFTAGAVIVGPARFAAITYWSVADTLMVEGLAMDGLYSKRRDGQPGGQCREAVSRGASRKRSRMHRGIIGNFWAGGDPGESCRHFVFP